MSPTKGIDDFSHIEEAPTLDFEDLPSTYETGGVLNGRYLLGAELGRGGMGQVFLAQDTKLDIEVAIKLLQVDSADRASLQKILSEARTLAALNHPNILRVWDVIDDAEAPYIVMEYIDGGDLRKTLAQDAPLTLPQVLPILEQICAALDAAHRRGIIHRDVKPSNVLLTHEGVAKLSDFGLALRVSVEPTSSSTRYLGTPGYLAPEQEQDPDHADQRADVYSVGAMLYEMLTGEQPRHIYLDPLPPPSRAVLHKALATRPDQRYHTAGELLTAFREATHEERQSSETKAESIPTVPSKTTGHAAASVFPCYICDSGVPDGAGFCPSCGLNLKAFRNRIEVAVDVLLGDANHRVQTEIDFSPIIQLLKDTESTLRHNHFATLHTRLFAYIRTLETRQAELNAAREHVRHQIYQGRRALEAGKNDKAEQLASEAAELTGPHFQDLSNEANELRRDILKANLERSAVDVEKYLAAADFSSALAQLEPLRERAKSESVFSMVLTVITQRIDRVKALRRQWVDFSNDLESAEKILDRGRWPDARAAIEQILSKAKDPSHRELHRQAERLMQRLETEERHQRYQDVLSQSLGPVRFLEDLAPLFAETDARFDKVKRLAIKRIRISNYLRFALGIALLMLAAAGGLGYLLFDHSRPVPAPSGILQTSAESTAIRRQPNTDKDETPPTLPRGTRVRALSIALSPDGYPWVQARVMQGSENIVGYIAAWLLVQESNPGYGEGTPALSWGRVRKAVVPVVGSMVSGPSGSRYDPLEVGDWVQLRQAVIWENRDPSLWYQIDTAQGRGYIPRKTVRMLFAAPGGELPSVLLFIPAIMAVFGLWYTLRGRLVHHRLGQLEKQ